MDALCQAAEVEKENHTVRYYPIDYSKYMKHLEMVRGNVLEKGMGYFVLFFNKIDSGRTRSSDLFYFI